MGPTLVARNDDGLTNMQLYHYQPSMPATVVFIVLFALATGFHFYQMIRNKTWFLIPFVIGGIFETVGYSARASSASANPQSGNALGPYIIQSVLTLVAPALFAASIYMELGRIALMVKGDRALIIRRTWLTKVFVIGDVFSFFLQSSGAGLLAAGSSEMTKIGKDVVVAGLFCQVVFFGLFIVAAVIFHVRLSKAPTQLANERPWSKHIVSLYLVSLLIFVRSIFRCVEYLQGYHGFIMTHEAFLYGFDATIMFIAVVTMNLIHPGEVAGYVRELKTGDEIAKEGTASMNDAAV